MRSFIVDMRFIRIVKLLYLGVYSFNDWNDNPNYACISSNIPQNFGMILLEFSKY
jgi:hypothetical protein